MEAIKHNGLVPNSSMGKPLHATINQYLVLSVGDKGRSMLYTFPKGTCWAEATSNSENQACSHITVIELHLSEGNSYSNFSRKYTEFLKKV